jgi:hypothetical protein
MHDTLLERFGGFEGGEPRGEPYEEVDVAVQSVKLASWVIDLQKRSEAGEGASRRR